MTPSRRPAAPRPLLVAGLLVAALAAFGGGLYVALATRSGGPALTGTDLGHTPAPDFALTDQRGHAVRLSDFRGRAVVLTFIYTHCPDVCPLTAENLRVADGLLPPAARERVALLAVTIDPERDTAAALQAFSASHGLAANPRWFALRGDRAALAPVWRSYGVYPGALPSADQGGAGSPSTMAMAPGAGTAPGAYQLGHTDAVYVIDPKGRERVLLRSGLDPRALAKDLHALVG